MILGVDAGSKFLKIARRRPGLDVDYPLHREHHGSPEKVILEFIEEQQCAVTKTFVSGHFSDQILKAVPGSVHVDEIGAIIAAARAEDCLSRYIVNVGAGSIKYIELNKKGKFHSYRENSLCAAGTGSFLDEQMNRMNFDYENIAVLKLDEEPPPIATRCAVFAKSDLIHRQQEGYTRDAMWSGLCRGVVNTLLNTVFRGQVPRGPVLFCGGLFLNHHVRYWVEQSVPDARFHDRGEFFTALGALENSAVSAKTGKIHGRETGGNATEQKTLKLEKSDPSAITPEKEYIRRGSEVRIHRTAGNSRPLALGIDIGSTSTKCIVIDAGNNEVLCDVYRKTEGDPLGAVENLFQVLKEIIGLNDNIISCATTGSGRKLVGNIIGADLIINEITAHYKGAAFFDPGIETVFEIGGQDSKYIRGSGGEAADCTMNFVCAAGTGSFIEEQAGKLGYDVREIGELTLGKRIPHTSDRCTVFMEQDINKLLREGYSREEVLAGVLHSVAKNYLHHVVGTKPVTGEKIFFQGATARNRGLVAAFELLLGREIVVSPYCHVMGAFGAAVLSLQRKQEGPSRFRGLNVFEHNIRLAYQQCNDCVNRCTITMAGVGNEPPAQWGFMCGRESLESGIKGRPGIHFSKIGSLLNNRSCAPEERKSGSRATLGIPLTLSMYSYLPLWKTFFEECGFDVKILNKSTQEMKERAAEIARADFCFPMKMGFAYMHRLASHGDVDAVFFPTIISDKKQKNNLPRIFCPYLIAFSSISKHTLDLPVPVINPSFDFRLDEKINIKELYRALSSYGLDKRTIRRALNAGMQELKQFKRKRYELGKNILERLREEHKTGIVFIGRPYNLYDKVINLSIPDRFSEYDVEVFPFEYLLDPEEDDSNVRHMYWNYGERILSSAEKIKDMEHVYPVYFTNFGCGPDSFLLSRFENIMQDKPYLIIELDEHASATGYLTRIEAFMDVVLSKERKGGELFRATEHFHVKWKNKQRKLWLPPMHELIARLLAAGFRAYGFDAESLPVEKTSSLEIGRSTVRGSECLPALTTIGVFLEKMKEINARPEDHAFFMPTAEGPCRYGQYTVLHRYILDKNGFAETEIFSPSSINSYMGMPESLRVYLYDIVIAGDLLMKYICTRRPYEKIPGEVDLAAEKAIARLEDVTERKGDLLEELPRALEIIETVPVNNVKKPLVGIVGEIYVRCNPFCNNFLIRDIEAYGGEAWLSPTTEWFLYTAWMERYFSRQQNWSLNRKIWVAVKTAFLFKRCEKFDKAAARFLGHRHEPSIERLLEIATQSLPLDFEGEAPLTIGRAAAFAQDGADLVVNCAPFGCMPGNLTGALFQKIEKKYGIAVLNLFYDGESDINRMVGVYLNNVVRTGDTKEVESLRS